jgi:hypothetical protein
MPKSIYIVKEKGRDNEARVLSFLLGKEIDVKSSIFTEKQFVQNEHQWANSQPVIFLGDTDPARSYLPMVKMKYDQFGIQWGWDYTKLVILARTTDLLSRDLEKIDKDVTKEFKKESQKVEWYGTALHFVLFFPAILPIVVWSWLAEEQKSRRLQYSIAIKTFIMSGARKFIKDSATVTP